MNAAMEVCCDEGARRDMSIMGNCTYPLLHEMGHELKEAQTLEGCRATFVDGAANGTWLTTTRNIAATLSDHMVRK